MCFPAAWTKPHTHDGERRGPASPLRVGSIDGGGRWNLWRRVLFHSTAPQRDRSTNRTRRRSATHLSSCFSERTDASDSGITDRTHRSRSFCPAHVKSAVSSPPSGPRCLHRGASRSRSGCGRAVLADGTPSRAHRSNGLPPFGVIWPVYN